MELRQLQDKAASYENENERFQRSLLEAHQKLADERVKSEAKERGLIFKVRVLGTIDLETIKCCITRTPKYCNPWSGTMGDSFEQYCKMDL